MSNPTLGLRENLPQFILLVIVNAFVGGMIGLERTILPKIAEQEFSMAAGSAVLSFIVVFGIVKAITNYFTGRLANQVGKKNLLIIGWVLALPVPLMLMYAPSWSWIVAANVLLGIHQGLSWSTTVMMKIDLVGEKQRGFAMGLNEFAGYLAVAIVAFLTGWVAGEYGVRPYPFYIGIVIAVAGLITTIALVKDTRHHVEAEKSFSTVPRLKNVFADTTFRHNNLSSVTQAGLINNLNDGMVWGLLPVILAVKGFAIQDIGVIAAIYPGVWGISQLFTGKLADIFCKKKLLFYGMMLQAAALFAMVFAESYWAFASVSAVLGFGTAMVYPTFLASVSENTHPTDRPGSLGAFRFWRDLGYAIGALLTGFITDWLGMNEAVVFIALLTLFSAVTIHFRMACAEATSFFGKKIDSCIPERT
jgi:MFS family permease